MEGDISSAMGGSGSLAGDMPSLKSLLQLKKKYDAPDAEDLPDVYKRNSDKERLYLWAAQNFREQIKHKYPTLDPLCLTCKNECDAEKLVMTFIKPTVLPYSHLFDLKECSKFVSDYLFYQTRGFSGKLWSPTHVLATQIGSSLEISSVLVSFLLGFGFKSFVVCGWVDATTSRMDRSEELCKLLEESEADKSIDEFALRSKYTPKSPPTLSSKYLDFLRTLQEKSDVTRTGKSVGKNRKEKSKKQFSKDNDDYFHGWVYVDLPNGTSFFIEATTGEKKSLDDPSIRKIIAVWDDKNYWLKKDPGWKMKNNLQLGNEKHWIKFVCDVKKNDECSPKRLLTNLQSWMGTLTVPRDSFELMYRLGQKTVQFKGVKVENYAPYLLKDGIVQKVTVFQDDGVLNAKGEPKAAHILEKFRFRSDKMVSRETFPNRDKVVENFAVGRKDRLKKREFFVRGSAHHRPEDRMDICTFYHESRLDGLSRRLVRGDDMELTEEYIGRESDGMIGMHVTFGMAKKEFGPADGKGGAKEVCKITEKFAENPAVLASENDNGDSDDDLGDPDDLESDWTPGRVLDTRKVLERVFDLEGDRILLKFHREGGQIFCKTVEFFMPARASHIPAAQTDQANSKDAVLTEIPQLSESDARLYLVDPRDKKPCILELSDIFREQMVLQKAAAKRVTTIQKEMHQLLEDRMKELSANDMEVWVFDTKRNPHVLRGRKEQEELAKRKQESVMDLELDLLAPYLERYPDVNSLSKAQALEVRDECLSNIRANLADKEKEMQGQIESLKLELANSQLLPEVAQSKKFHLNVMESRLVRQKTQGYKFYQNAVHKVKTDKRLAKFFITS